MMLLLRLRIIPFDLPPGCLRDFPGLSQYFVEFDDEDAARRATSVYVPSGINVDPLHSALELVPLFESLQHRHDLSHSESSSTGKRKRTRAAAKNCPVQDRVVAVCCTGEYDESEVHSAFSSCGEMYAQFTLIKIDTLTYSLSYTHRVRVYAWKSAQKHKRRFFVEFARTEGVDCARRARYPRFEVAVLSQNMQWMKSFKRCAKLGRWGLSIHPQNTRTTT